MPAATELFRALGRAGLLLAAGAAMSAAAPLSLEDRLKQVEDQLQSLRAENQALRQQFGVDAKDPHAFIHARGKVQRLAVGGYVQSQFEAGASPDNRYTGISDRFLIRRARLNVVGSFAERFDFKFEGDFGNNGVAGRPGYSAQGTDVMVNWRHSDYVQVKLGQFKTPFGYEQLLPDIWTPTAERTLVNDRLTLNRQIGLGAHGDLLGKRLGYSVGLFNGNGTNNGSNDNSKFASVGRLAGVPLQTAWAGEKVKWTLGVNAYHSEDASVSGLSSSDQRFDSSAAPGVNQIFAGRRPGWGVDSQFKWGRCEVAAEVLGAHFRPRNGNFTATPTDDDFRALGWWILAGCHVSPTVQAIVRFESLDMNRHVRGNTTDEWSIGLNCFIKGDELKLQLNYLLGDPFAGRDHQGRFIARAQVVF